MLTVATAAALALPLAVLLGLVLGTVGALRTWSNDRAERNLRAFVEQTMIDASERALVELPRRIAALQDSAERHLAERRTVSAAYDLVRAGTLLVRLERARLVLDGKFDATPAPVTNLFTVRDRMAAALVAA